MTATKIGPRSRFFACLRKSLYAGTIPPGAVAGHEAILDRWESLVAGGDRRQLAYVLATAFHETCGRLQPVEENLNYSAVGLRRTFPQRFSLEAAEECAPRPETIANRAYANRMGNGDIDSGDGFRFRGRGLVQIRAGQLPRLRHRGPAGGGAGAGAGGGDPDRRHAERPVHRETARRLFLR